MYNKTSAGREDRRKDLRLLWKLLHREDTRFSESLGWFGKKAMESDVPHNFDVMLNTYLMLLVKVDNRLFVGRQYWRIRDGRVDRTYWRLMRDGYAEKIAELALGAANLYEQTKCGGHFGKVGELRSLAAYYQKIVARHRKKYEGQPVNRGEGWELIRISNRFFAEVFDLVSEGASANRWQGKYCRFLDALDNGEEESSSCVAVYERLVHPRKTQLKRLVRKLKPTPWNMPKKVDRNL